MKGACDNLLVSIIVGIGSNSRASAENPMQVHRTEPLLLDVWSIENLVIVARFS